MTQIIAFSSFLILLTAGVLASQPLSQTDKQKESILENKKEAMCGPKSLSLLCEILGVKVPVKEIAQLAKVDEQGTSMKGLADAAYKLGFKAVGMKIGMNELMQMKQPVIAHLTQEHFVVVESITKQGVLRLFDPAGEDKIMNPKAFSEVWSGYILKISPTSKIEQADGPDIEIEKPIFDFGESSQEKIIPHDFIIKNVGKAPLKIEEISKSCTCTAAITKKKIVPPGETTCLRVEYNTKHSRGRVGSHIAIHTNDPDERVAFVTITGLVAGIIYISPNYIHLNDVHFNETVHKVIEVYDPGHGKLKVKKVTSSVPYIQAKINSKFNNKKIAAIIDVTIKPGLPLREIKEKITIETNDRKYPKTEVLVKGSVIGDLKLYPKQFFLGFVKQGSTAKQMVKLTKIREPNLKIIKIENQSKSVDVKIVTVKPGQEYKIQVICTPSEKEGLIKDVVRVYTNNEHQPIFNIPVYGIIQ